MLQSSDPTYIILRPCVPPSIFVDCSVFCVLSILLSQGEDQRWQRCIPPQMPMIWSVMETMVSSTSSKRPDAWSWHSWQCIVLCLSTCRNVSDAHSMAQWHHFLKMQTWHIKGHAPTACVRDITLQTFYQILSHFHFFSIIILGEYLCLEWHFHIIFHPFHFYILFRNDFMWTLPPRESFTEFQLTFQIHISPP